MAMKESLCDNTPQNPVPLRRRNCRSVTPPTTGSTATGADGGGAAAFAQPSHSRQRFNTSVWPEPFLEALATQIAIDAADSIITAAGAGGGGFSGEVRSRVFWRGQI
ncbi:hypothetical protein SSX86_003919 [Deinandra increscens subsp. villosa]|uniref:Uncharacterized protein n=1 Tax=Deinandra increscens subsp. villosa TaxID=3103831 RepID=A0AAP0DR45_9ASTR